jgi:tetratricopeptide (TPR) repeat protein
LQPYSADAHNNLGVALEAKGQVNLAIAEFKEAVRLDRNYARAHFNLGSALAKVGQLDASLDELQRALNLKSDYTAAQTNLAAVREMKKRASQR